MAEAVSPLQQDMLHIFTQTFGVLPEHRSSVRFTSHLNLLIVIAKSALAEFIQRDKAEREFNRLTQLTCELLIPQYYALN